MNKEAQTQYCLDNWDLWMAKLRKCYSYIISNKNQMTDDAIDEYITKTIEDALPPNYRKKIRIF